MLQSIAQQSDGLQSGLQSGVDYLAVVVDNNDPEKLQRIRVSISGVLEGDSPEDLPWVTPIQPQLFGIGDNFGIVKVPRVGSKVVVRYGPNPPISGFYLGDIVTARTELPEELTVNYPNRIGWSNPVGDVMYTDLQEKTFYYRHNSGTSVEVAADGTMRINVAKDLQVTVTGDLVLTVQGDMSTTVQGDATSMVQGNESRAISGDVNLNAQGKMSQLVGGKLNTVCASHTHVGRLNSTDDVIAAGISVVSHIHPNGSPFTGSAI